MPTLPAPDHDTGPESFHLAFVATPVSVRDGLACMMSAPPLCHLSQDRRGTAELVLAEVLNNVAEHAYPETTGPVSVSIGRTDKGLRCVVVDQGLPMPDGVLPTGELPVSFVGSPAALPEGGFGWHLIRSLTTDLNYSRVDGCNHLQFNLI